LPASAGRPSRSTRPGRHRMVGRHRRRPSSRFPRPRLMVTVGPRAGPARSAAVLGWSGIRCRHDRRGPRVRLRPHPGRSARSRAAPHRPPVPPALRPRLLGPRWRTRPPLSPLPFLQPRSLLSCSTTPVPSSYRLVYPNAPMGKTPRLPSMRRGEGNTSANRDARPERPSLQAGIFWLHRSMACSGLSARRCSRSPTC